MKGQLPNGALIDQVQAPLRPRQGAKRLTIGTAVRKKRRKRFGDGRGLFVGVDIQETLIRAARVFKLGGMDPAEACQILGVSKTTYYRWAATPLPGYLSQGA